MRKKRDESLKGEPIWYYSLFQGQGERSQEIILKASERTSWSPK